MILLAVPNISEGRRPDLVRDIAGHSDALLDVHVDPDHNRSVLTYGGNQDELRIACTGLVDRAVRSLDITAHEGVHPRFGVVDVLPIVPYTATEDAARDLARELAARSPVPAYFYDDEHPLPELRRRLRAPHDAHPTAGVLCVGVRGPLVAFNVNLRAAPAEARRLVPLVRALDGVRALAFELPSRGLVQVSMNLTRLKTTGPSAVYDVIATNAAAHIVDAEVVGLVPETIAGQLDDIPLRTPARTIEEALGR